jgi:hypothetical protein
VPVTLFHRGPAVVLEAACPRHFSLGVFTLVLGSLVWMQSCAPLVRGIGLLLWRALSERRSRA